MTNVAIVPIFDQDGDTIMTNSNSKSPIETYFSFKWPKITFDSYLKDWPLTAEQESEITTTFDEVEPKEVHNSKAVPDPEHCLQLHWQIKIPEPPPEPAPWTWECHVCRHQYPLHVTRRCLYDGHYYCSGNNKANSQRSMKQRKRGQSCSSHFDYIGWERWGNWKRKSLALKAYANGKAAPVLHRCEDCDFPNQCYVEKKAPTKVLLPKKYLAPAIEFAGSRSLMLPKVKVGSDEQASKVENEQAKNVTKKSHVRQVTETQADSHWSSSTSSEPDSTSGKHSFNANTSNTLSSTDLADVRATKKAQSSSKTVELGLSASGCGSSKSSVVSSNVAANESRPEVLERSRQPVLDHDSNSCVSAKPTTVSSAREPSCHRSLLTDFFKEKHSAMIISSSSDAPLPLNSSTSSDAISTEYPRSKYNSSTVNSKMFIPGLDLITPDTCEPSSATSSSAFSSMDDFQFDFELDQTSLDLPEYRIEKSQATDAARLVARPNLHTADYKPCLSTITTSSSASVVGNTHGMISRWKKRRQNTHGISDWEDISLAD